jgi:cysteine desulfurase
MLWFKKKKRIYLDYASATPVRKEVRQAMEKYWSESFYNPSAIYREGLEVKNEVEDCRARIASIMGAGGKEIIFTASGTEANNLAILGAFEAFKESEKNSKYPINKPHVIISAIEHPSIIRAAEEVVRRGGEMSILPVDEEGLVNPEALKLALKHNTFLVSVGLANSEIGVVEPVAKLGRVVREHRKDGSLYPLLHTDASPAPAYLPVNLESLQCDLITLDGSKIYGPKGIGMLAVRRGVSLRPLVMGGGQEKGLRSGTLNPALIAGFTVALELAAAERETEVMRIGRLRKIFLDAIEEKFPQIIVNGSWSNRLPNIISLSIPDNLSEFILLKLDNEGVMVSVGTACSLDERTSGSPVIRALGKVELAESTIRVSMGKFTTEDEIKSAIEIFCRILSNMVK